MGMAAAQVADGSSVTMSSPRENPGNNAPPLTLRCTKARLYYPNNLRDLWWNLLILLVIFSPRHCTNVRCSCIVGKWRPLLLAAIRTCNWDGPTPGINAIDTGR